MKNRFMQLEAAGSHPIIPSKHTNKKKSKKMNIDHSQKQQKQHQILNESFGQEPSNQNYKQQQEQYTSKRDKKSFQVQNNIQDDSSPSSSSSSSLQQQQQSSSSSSSSLHTIRTFIGHLRETPKYLRDNDYIKTGYRIGFNSVSRILRSLFELHNESVNVWSHLIGALGLFIMIFVVAFYIGPVLLPVIFEQVSHAFKAFQDGSNQVDNPFMKTIEESNTNALQSAQNIAYSFSRELGVINNKLDSSLLFLPQILQSFSQICPIIRSSVNQFSDEQASQFTKDKISSLNKIYHNLQCKISEALKKIEDKVITQHITPLLNEIVQLMGEIPRWPIILQIISGIMCLMFSSIFHLCSAHSPKASTCLSRLDYAGISLLIAGSNIPPSLYIFYCHSNLAIIYSSLMSFFCFVAFIITLLPKFDQPKLRPIRGIMFVFVGLLSIMPIIHTLIKEHGKLFYDFPPIYFALGGAIYIAGAIIYVSRFPQRSFPGKFDIWGSSHQIWHFMIVAAASIHIYASIDIYYKRQNVPCLASDAILNI